MKPSIPIRLLAALAATTLAACNQSPTANHAAASAPAPASSTKVHAPVAAAPARASTTTAPLPGDHATTQRYRIDITLPTLPADEAKLADALRATADTAKQQFLQTLPDPAQAPEAAKRPFQLLLDFKLAANTATFTSVRETGSEDTGGAHPMPVEAGFVFDRKAGKLIPLDDLFSDPDAARKTLANFTRDALLKKLMGDAIHQWEPAQVQMLNDGTQPIPINYSVFVVRAGATDTAASPGLTLIFPPYQVAAYVYGTQTVDVPASIFAQFLKPAYRNDFAASSQ
jgi:Protein of unknown function (DUF3298)